MFSGVNVVSTCKECGQLTSMQFPCRCTDKDGNVEKNGNVIDTTSLVLDDPSIQPDEDEYSSDIVDSVKGIYDELSTTKWKGTNEGWNKAIEAVKAYINEDGRYEDEDDDENSSKCSEVCPKVEQQLAVIEEAVTTIKLLTINSSGSLDLFELEQGLIAVYKEYELATNKYCN